MQIVARAAKQSNEKHSSMKFQSRDVGIHHQHTHHQQLLSVYSIAILFISAGILHFVASSTYVRIMPRWLPFPKELVYLSGAFEIIGGIAVLPSKTRRIAGYGLIALLLAVFPANIQMLLNARASNSSQGLLTLLWLRLPLQFLLVVWVYKATQTRK
jgi:uncharacterized membrane protein